MPQYLSNRHWWFLKKIKIAFVCICAFYSFLCFSDEDDDENDDDDEEVEGEEEVGLDYLVKGDIDVSVTPSHMIRVHLFQLLLLP